MNGLHKKINNMEKKMNRRLFLKGVGATGVATFLAPQLATAAIGNWPQSTMEEKDLAVLKQSLGANAQEAALSIKAPQIAENGATVPVEVDATSVPGNVESISLLVSGNPRPLVATFNFANGGVGIVGTRVKMGKTGDFIVYVKTDKGVFMDKREIKVTIGGCGG